jgi:hypothetical protein
MPLAQSLIRWSLIRGSLICWSLIRWSQFAGRGSLLLRIAIVAAGLLSGTILHGEIRRHALLIGINDYSASHLTTPAGARLPFGRDDWPDLSGAAVDARAFGELLTLLYGFAPDDIVTLTDQAATRAAMLHTLGQLADSASKDDVVFFYFAGHGSQVRNSLSDEPDGLDESIVPADSRRGAPDIRDKELRILFNRILDRGARLTVMLDNCHSGSGARGLPTGARPRGIKPDLRDVADPSRGAGPRPENRGALVLMASQDFAQAWETHDPQGTMHGTFTWAWMRALRDAAPGEAAMTTFLRAQARMRAETPFQEPVLAGSSDARLRPFLGTSAVDRGEPRKLVAVSKVHANGTVLLQGGWANGLAAGNELQVVNAPNIRLTITTIDGLARSEARVTPATLTGAAIKPGTLVEASGWTAPPPNPLHVWMPNFDRSAAELEALGHALAARAAARNVRWITNPLDVTPVFVLRPHAGGWELIASDGHRETFASDAAALDAIARLPIHLPAAGANQPCGASLFVQFPVPAELARTLGLGTHTAHAEIAPVPRAEDADYILTGRYAGGQLGYAWLRPAVTQGDRRKSGLPLRTDWIAARSNAPTEQLREAVFRLRTIHDWQLLESPPEGRFPYHLDLRRSGDDALPRQNVVTGGERYSLVLRAGSAFLPAHLAPRYHYVFLLDSFGRSVLLYPRSGSVENRFPLSDPPPPEIALDSAFEVTPPYGIDTYVLLSTDEPLPNPWILDSEGVRSRDPRALTPLERLLQETATGTRGATLVLPSAWSIDRFVYESVAPPKRRGGV